jgi:hypothetical protein
MNESSKMVTLDGRHGLSCRKGSGRHSRHNQVNDLLCRAFISTGTRDGKRPDGVTQVPWKRGRCLAWDATCPDTFAQSHVQASSILAGSAAASAEEKKTRKYSHIISGVDFVPAAIETSRVWGTHAMDLVTVVGRPSDFSSGTQATVNYVLASTYFGGCPARQHLVCSRNFSKLQLK